MKYVLKSILLAIQGNSPDLHDYLSCVTQWKEGKIKWKWKTKRKKKYYRNYFFFIFGKSQIVIPYFMNNSTSNIVYTSIR